MKTNRTYIVIILLLIFYVFTFFKCTKDLPIPACTNGCNGIVFAGKVINEAYNTPISNAQIQVTTPGDYGAIDTIYVIGTVNTDANGNFTIVKSIDTAIHKQFTVVATMPNGYLTAPETLDQFANSPTNLETQFFIGIDSSIQNIQFGAFPITKLAIKLHRNSALLSGNTYEVFNLSCSINSIYSVSPTYTAFAETPQNADTVINIETAPVLINTISWDTSTDTSTLVNGSVSIKCQSNTTNEITINY